MSAKDAKTYTVERFDMITVSILWCLGTKLKCLKWKARQSIAIDRFDQPNVYIFNQIWAEQINIKNALKCGLPTSRPPRILYCYFNYYFPQEKVFNMN